MAAWHDVNHYGGMSDGNTKSPHQAVRLRKRQPQAMWLGEPYGLWRDLERTMSASAQMLGPKRVAWYDRMQP